MVPAASAASSRLMALCKLALFMALVHVGECRTACKSAMPGDFGHESCGAFCKIDKKANHCRYCKCKECSFCSGNGGKEALDDAARSALQQLPTPGSGGKGNMTRRKKRAGSRNASTGSASHSHSSSSSSGSKHKQCRSGIKGDFNYEMCGAFCKSAKATNHCKFCKCRTCTFCGGTATKGELPTQPTASASAAVPIAAAAAAPSAAASSAPVAAAAPASYSAPAAAAPVAARPFASGGGKPPVVVKAAGGATTTSAPPPQPGVGMMVIVWAVIICGLGGLCAYVVDGQLRNASMDGVSRGERSGLMRAGRSPVDEMEAAADGVPQPGLDAAFRNVELLEESLKKKDGSA